MIGSRIKVAAVMKALREEGFAQGVLSGVHTPIGLSIEAQTPAEIAVSILAEIVQERARKGPGAVPPPEEPGVLCTIVKKSGSAPRARGHLDAGAARRHLRRGPSGGRRGGVPGQKGRHGALGGCGREMPKPMICPTPPPSWGWCAGARSTWNLRCEDERDPAVYSEGLSPL